ncbi:MAG: patatin-like phospholipase family protein [Cyclobacteriaceae bacterium]
MAEGKKISLVLSSGGARGLAHIGVIERLEEEGFEIAAIAGSSIGAVIGAFYACGQLETYKKWVLNLDRLDLFNLFDFTISTKGFIKGDKLFRSLEELIDDRPLERLRIPFTAIATDIVNQKEVLFESGSMYAALRASTAIPTVIRPVVKDGIELIDGGVINPMPMDRVKRSPGDLMVVVNINANIEYERPALEVETQKKMDKDYTDKLNSFVKKWSSKVPTTSTSTKTLGFLELVNRSLDLMQDQLTNAKISQHKPDLVINFSKKACTTFEFYKAKEMIQGGRDAFDREFEKLKKLA